VSQADCRPVRSTTVDDRGGDGEGRSGAEGLLKSAIESAAGSRRPLLSVLTVLFLAVACLGCPSADSSPDVRDDVSRDCTAPEPENPFADGSGHHAGFEWAQTNNPSSCGGNSQSFIEGCQEYQRQAAAHAACVGNR